ncbi:MAG: alpha-amylase, partial [Abditibacteriota bacterium]|nr:alpha-amylase [Abditibacteriota bacterium]
EEESLAGLMALFSAKENPAYPAKELLFDTGFLPAESLKKAEKALFEEGEKRAAFAGNTKYTMTGLLTLGARLHPDSLYDQLDCYARRFPAELAHLMPDVLKALDFYKEETRPPRSGAPAEAQAPVYDDDIFLTGAESYSPDAGWMAASVLLAKNVLVWLWQLSEKYGLPVGRLDEIPDEELDEIKEQGFTALWLIGLWDRGSASRSIKRWNGNGEAEGSAYSVRRYAISERLGGEEALQNLKARAMRRGIRLAADMVPNHTALDAPLLGEHPEYYLQRASSPYPNYAFSGESLSGSRDYGVFLEDHYFDHTDASVVFLYKDYRTGEERYIYHGNDGTSMPWNDTAQLDYLKPEVREYAAQTIIGVAKRFPIIRFDAAMTLTKKHFQRLWYPLPGTGGDIPSRAEEGLSADEFNALFPAEFWREVVDRVAKEAPDTLLLAEAFWLLEGYFVRTLGMHRVYNSAFMNMLRNEDNEKYHNAIKNTLEFDPDILQRYVNFMSNPDEKTAVEQFGTGDKYFGICILMCTLPGLPMFAHGQTEGLREKYGMEYGRPYYGEKRDEGLWERHKREIFPLLKLRSLFAGAGNFRLYPFITENGPEDSDVFAFGNKNGAEKALVFYNNRFKTATGSIRESAPFKNKETGALQTESLAEALGLEDNRYLIWKDLISGLEYIRPSAEVRERGLGMQLDAYKYAVFTGFRETEDDAFCHYRQLCERLGGRGVPSVEAELAALRLGPLYTELAGFFEKAAADMKDPETLEEPLRRMLEKAGDYMGGSGYAGLAAEKIKRTLGILYSPEIQSRAACASCSLRGVNRALFLWAVIRHLACVRFGTDDPVRSAALAEEWGLEAVARGFLFAEDYPVSPEEAFRCVAAAVDQTFLADGVRAGEKTAAAAVKEAILSKSMAKAIGANRFNGVVWFRKELFALACDLTSLSQEILALEEDVPRKKAAVRYIEGLRKRLPALGEAAGWRLKDFLAGAQGEIKP